MAKRLHLRSFLPTLDALQGACASRMRATRVPSTQASMRWANSCRKTVCGQAYPHQMRPSMLEASPRASAPTRRPIQMMGVSSAVKSWPRR